MTLCTPTVKLISVNFNFPDTLKKQAAEILLGICPITIQLSFFVIDCYRIWAVVLSSSLWQDNVSPYGFAYKRRPNVLVNVTVLRSSVFSARILESGGSNPVATYKLIIINTEDMASAWRIATCLKYCHLLSVRQIKIHHILKCNLEVIS